jgi:hypothetical protein
VTEKLYPTRYLIPAVITKHQPELKKLLKWQWRRGKLYIQWRWPKEKP